MCDDVKTPIVFTGRPGRRHIHLVQTKVRGRTCPVIQGLRHLRVGPAARLLRQVLLERSHLLPFTAAPSKRRGFAHLSPPSKTLMCSSPLLFTAKWCQMRSHPRPRLPRAGRSHAPPRWRAASAVRGRHVPGSPPHSLSVAPRRRSSSQSSGSPC